jgi:hypothetical protein
MAKPICLIKVIPDRFTVYGKNVDVNSLLSELNKIFQDRMPDYHVFVISQESFTIDGNINDTMTFEVFYEKDEQPIDYEGLKKIIEENLPAKTE